MSIQEINVGSVPNDKTGDSIRDAFTKANENFQFLDDARQNLTTGNLVATGNISLQASTASYWTGGPYYIDGIQIATVGTTFSGGTVANPTTFQSTTPSTSNVTGAVIVTGGLGVGGNTHIGGLFAKSATIEAGLTAATIVIGSTAQFDAAVATGALTTTGTNTTTGNITVGNVSAAASNTNKRSVAASFGQFSEITGTLQTASQPNVTGLGTLTGLAVTGNISAANITLTWGQVTATKAVITGNVVVGANLLVTGTGAVTGNLTTGNVIKGIGTFNNMTVQTIPTVKSVTTKEYVTATVVGFAIGLGS
jgi:hypothetical protein